MTHDGVRLRSVMRSVAFLTAGALAVPALAGCGSGDEADDPAAAQDIAPAARAGITDGGTVRWAVDTMPGTLNTFQADADAATSRIAGTVLPAMFRLDEHGRPEPDADYLQSAKVVDTKPKQVVLYELGRQAKWSNGRRLSAVDFAAQWRALSGKEAAYWTARNAGYDRIEKVERGATASQVRVTFSRAYADWRSLFTPLYPKEVMGSPGAFNDGARRKLKVTAGPFTLGRFDAEHDEVTVQRNPRWWGKRAKLSKIVFRAVPRGRRAAALAAGSLDVADVEASDARRIARAARDRAGRGPLGRGGAPTGSDDAPRGASEGARGSHEEADARGRTRRAIEAYAAEQAGLRRFVIRKSLEPAYTQLALNGSAGPLADDRVRRAVARAIDREELARLVLKPLGLPAQTVGSHLALAGQDGYADGSGALGKQDTAGAEALLADAGWVRGGAGAQKGASRKEAGEARQGEKAAGGEQGARDESARPAGGDDKPAGNARAEAGADRVDAGAEAGRDGARHAEGVAPGAQAPDGTAAPAGAAAGPLAKNGKPLLLRFVLPSGPGSEALRAVGERISRMLDRVGIRTVVTKVADDSYFNDHVAAGQYDLALYSWPASAFPATDARPIFAKPVPGADGSLNVEQNYTRVGTDRIDQLFDQAMAELDSGKERDLVRKADARIWAAAGSIPLYQRPQLVAVRTNLVNVGAFGFEDPRYEDIGFLKAGSKGAAALRQGGDGPSVPERAPIGAAGKSDHKGARTPDGEPAVATGTPSKAPAQEDGRGTGPDGRHPGEREPKGKAADEPADGAKPAGKGAAPQDEGAAGAEAR
ncbi:lipoprotein [Streptomyces sulfonofaciens]|uniref:Lipoprotein n=1 Tax=Streptomyces sulfonofaciens TaxID=68272 RepID=A0A919GCC0_9ACTN|nr:ABC transporter substrate-binding protein [Streptomyces sulfonofaciens]GHH81344.1 lipoprotein [Streptomyces sulfonofaciens]